MLLGAVLGFEREMGHKPAGLRAHTMLAGTATALVAVSDLIVRHFDVKMGQTVVQSDPLRIIEAVITGVSFLSRVSLACRAPVHAKLQPIKENFRLMPYSCSGTALGAGTISRRGSVAAVEGLTTAASLLFVAGVGITVALSQWVLAAGVVALALATLRVLRVFSKWSGRHLSQRNAWRPVYKLPGRLAASRFNRLS